MTQLKSCHKLVAVCQEGDLDVLNALLEWLQYSVLKLFQTRKFWETLYRNQHSFRYTVGISYLSVTFLNTVFYCLNNKANTAVFLNCCPNIAVTENSSTGVSLKEISTHQKLIKIILNFLYRRQKQKEKACTKYVKGYNLGQVLYTNLGLCSISALLN